jgi:type IV pilus assembly protein PilM
MNALNRLSGALRRLGRGSPAGPIGLEIATEKLHMVQFDRETDPPSIRAAVSIPYEGGREALLADRKGLRALVDRARAERPFRGATVVSCLPQSDVRTIALTYQQAPGQSDDDAIAAELRERLKDELEGSVVDYIRIRSPVDEGAEKGAVVAIAARERVLAYLDALQGAGLEIEALDLGPAALARLVASMGKDVKFANVLLVNFGRERSYLSLIWGRRLMLDRDVAFGETRLVSRLAAMLDMAEPLALDLLYRAGYRAERCGGGDGSVAVTVREVLGPEFATLAAEIGKTLVYAASKTRGQSVERIYLTGSVARHPGVAALLEALVQMPVEVLDPFTVFTAAPGAAVLRELDPIAGIGMAAGLALRGSEANG